jgi:hypothetical protein
MPELRPPGSTSSASGRELSLERAADLALRVLDEELALVAAAGATQQVT